MDTEALKKNLPELRIRRGWSQVDLGREAGVRADTISSIERGKHEPRPSTLRKLADGLGVEIEALFSEEPEVPKEDAPSSTEAPEERRTVELSGTAAGRASAEGKMTVEVSLTLLWRTEAALETLENVTELEPDKQRQVREARNQVREALASGLTA